MIGTPIPDAAPLKQLHTTCNMIREYTQVKRLKHVIQLVSNTFSLINVGNYRMTNDLLCIDVYSNTPLPRTCFVPVFIVVHRRIQGV